jgi:hypothetical protein
MVFEPLQPVASALLARVPRLAIPFSPWLQGGIVCVMLTLTIVAVQFSPARAESECGADVVAHPVSSHQWMDVSKPGAMSLVGHPARHVPTPCERGMCHAPSQLPVVPPSSPSPPNFDQLFGPLASLSINAGESRDFSFASVVNARPAFQWRLERPPECAVVV